MKEVHKKIINAVIEKAKSKCPKSLALIGIYGSVQTKDTYKKSDLDLLILINDDEGWQLSDCFILEDEQIGYDIYCTSWQMLEEDAECHHAHIGKLMDAEIVYTANKAVTERLDKLKEKASDILRTEKRFQRVNEIQDQIYKLYAYAMTTDHIGKLREYSARVIYLSLDMVMIWNSEYFKRGTKRTFEELEGKRLPRDFKENIDKIIYSRETGDTKQILTNLLRSVISFTKRNENRIPPSKEALSGTYEEMFSNWRNKMSEAADRGDVFSSFMNMASLQVMFTELSDETALSKWNIMDKFDPDDLENNAAAFDNALENYRRLYEKLGIEPRCFKNIDEFAEDYLK
ncbi:MAG: hypothetical protein NC084_03050 [Bacteroides sp.]|nr:hypothetical protein [Eubacterium sp.]MCM1417614.1 hypothetical protein [Roseburia sp.]MCM1461674.1 hypothetical protein [Bacteroides sp.]